MIFGTAKINANPAPLFPARYTITRRVQAVVKDNNRAAKGVIMGKRWQNVGERESLQVTGTIRPRLKITEVVGETQ